MTATGIILLLTQIVTLAAAVMGFWTARKAKADIREIHVIMNSRLTELLKLTQTSAHAAGMKEQKDHPKRN